jgi:hypothetical protein
VFSGFLSAFALRMISFSPCVLDMITSGQRDMRKYWFAKRRRIKGVTQKKIPGERAKEKHLVAFAAHTYLSFLTLSFLTRQLAGKRTV